MIRYLINKARQRTDHQVGLPEVTLIIPMEGGGKLRYLPNQDI